MIFTRKLNASNNVCRSLSRLHRHRTLFTTLWLLYKHDSYKVSDIICLLLQPRLHEAFNPFQVDRSRGEKGHHFRISVVSPTHQLSLICMVCNQCQNRNAKKQNQSTQIVTTTHKTATTTATTTHKTVTTTHKFVTSMKTGCNSKESCELEIFIGIIG